MLRKIADFYDDEVDTAVSGLLALVEPVMVVALGIVVGGMVVAMYLPIFDLISHGAVSCAPSPSASSPPRSSGIRLRRRPQGSPSAPGRRCATT